jgi:hypothetical protein
VDFPDNTPEPDAEYTYLKLPRSSDHPSCVGVVLAGLISRAGIGVGGLEEAVEVLERSRAEGGTSYRFAILEDRIFAQIEDESGGETRESHGTGDSGWRTLAELVS